MSEIEDRRLLEKRLESGGEDGWSYGNRIWEHGLLEQILAKIPEREVFAIKSVFEDRTKGWIAKKLGVSRTRVYQIIRLGWDHVSEVGESLQWKEFRNERANKQYQEWRLAVLERDSYTCQDCGAKEDLDVHHIIMWKDDKDKRYDISNGLTLCYSCHKAVHPWYRRKGRKEEKDVPESNT
jgi:hypothetical protein